MTSFYLIYFQAKLRDVTVDYARGEANLYSDSSSDESSSEEDEMATGGDTFDKWGELDGDAEQTEEPTRRLAVCNMDWDRAGPEDIFLVSVQPQLDKILSYLFDAVCSKSRKKVKSTATIIIAAESCLFKLVN